MIRAWAGALAARLGLAAGGGGAAAGSLAARVDGALASLAAAEARARAPQPSGQPLQPLQQTPPLPPTPAAAALAEDLALPDAALRAARSPERLHELACALHASDPARASRLYVAAASKNHLPAVLTVALASAEPRGLGAIPHDLQRAEALLDKLAGPEVGSTWAAYALGNLLLRRLARDAAGDPSAPLPPRFHPAALPLPLRAAPAAQRAVALLRAAASPRARPPVPPASFNLAMCLLAGVGCPGGQPALEEGRGALEAGVAAGDPAAAAAAAAGAEALGAGGAGAAAALWRRAAEGGHPGAAHHVGLAYTRAAPPDWEAACVWFARAGEGGLARGAINHGGVLAHLGRLEEAEGVFERVQGELAAGRGGEGAGTAAALGMVRALLQDVRAQRAGGGGGEGREAGVADLVVKFNSVGERDAALAELQANEVSMEAVLKVMNKGKA